jgi:hypothetical protein
MSGSWGILEEDKVFALFPYPTTDGSGSPDQRTTGSASLLAFFRANVGASASTSFNQNFNPSYDLPSVVTAITRVSQGFTSSPSSTVSKVLFDFIETNPPAGTSHAEPNVTFAYGAIAEHDYVTNPSPCYGGPSPPPCPTPNPIAQVLRVGKITWETASCGNYFQANWTNSSESITAYQTLDFRVSRQIDNTHNLTESTNFQIQLVGADGNPTGTAVSLHKYHDLNGPVGLDNGTADGFLHPILRTVRIPLSDFVGANLSNVRGVRFIFSDTEKGAINLANVRLSNQP